MDMLDSAALDGIRAAARALAAAIAALPDDRRVEALNEARRALHEVSPFRREPIDLVLWVPADTIVANDYNPNQVAPPEMRLLAHSIAEDGYTQPIVTWTTAEGREVIDGFHRNRVGREKPAIRKRTLGHLPVTTVNEARTDKRDRMAATIRHNRARGKHHVEGMSQIVQDLTRRNWSEARIGRELGMDDDEVRRLKQISGLAEMFADRAFSEAWEIDEAALCRT